MRSRSLGVVLLALVPLAALLTMGLGTYLRPSVVVITKKAEATVAEKEAEAPPPVRNPVNAEDVMNLQAPRTIAEYKAQMAAIPGGTFNMGSNDSDDEKPVHKVSLSAFRMGRTPVTVAMWKEYCAATNKAMPSPPDWGWIDEHPIVNVSWNDAKAYCDWAKLKLPTEAQWEYAAKGGQDIKFPWGDTFDESKVVWDKNSGKRTAAVYRRARVFVNRFGLVDMAGNVWQWCGDVYDPNYYESSPGRDPQGPGSGERRVLRGGSWDGSDSNNFRAANRDWGNPSNRDDIGGFRAASSGPP